MTEQTDSSGDPEERRSNGEKQQMFSLLCLRFSVSPFESVPSAISVPVPSVTSACLCY